MTKENGTKKGAEPKPDGKYSETVGGITWDFEVKDGKATIVQGGQKKKGDVAIPAVLGGCPVTAIGEYAFQDCSGLASVTIPASVTSIGDNAFFECGSLDSFVVAKGGESFESQDGVLYSKDGKTLVAYPPGRKGCFAIPDSVTSIGDRAFEGCLKLTSVTIPASVPRIGDYVFCDCEKLTSVTIPASVTSIGNYAFWGCRKLTSVTIPDSVASIGEGAFKDCGKLTSVTIPASVANIGCEAFAGCKRLDAATRKKLKARWPDCL